MGQTSNSAQNSKQFGNNKKKGKDSSHGQQRNYLKRRVPEEMGVITVTIMCAPNAGRSIRECVDWEQTPATFMVRKATLQGIVP